MAHGAGFSAHSLQVQINAESNSDFTLHCRLSLLKYSYMLLRRVFLIFFACATLCACNKEESVDPGGNLLPEPGANVPNGKLARMVYSFGGSGTSVTDFLYDASGRWAGFKAPAGDPLLQGHTATRIMRNGEGVINAFTVKDEADGGQERTFRVYYNDAQKQYLARAGTVMLNGSRVVDSTVFIYANGRIVSGNIWIKPTAGGTATDYGKVEFSYDASGNITAIKTSLLDFSTNKIEPVSQLTMDLDDKPNAMPVGDEAIVLDYIYGANSNNIRKVSSLDLANGTDTVVNLYADYTYRGDEKPQTAEVHSGGATIQISYVYK